MKKAKDFSRFVIRVMVLSLVIAGLGLFGEKETKIVQAQTYQYTINPGHPKLFLTPQRLQEIKDWIQRDNPPEWQNLLSRAGYLGDNPDPNNTDHPTYTLINVFIYKITGDEIYGRRAVGYLLRRSDLWENQYLEWWNTGGKDGVRHAITGRPFESPKGPGNFIPYAITYDWINNLMTDVEKNKIIDIANKLVYGPLVRMQWENDGSSFDTSNSGYFPYDPNGNTIELKPPKGSSDSPKIVSRTPITFLDINWMIALWSVEAFWGMATFPENPEAQRFVDTTILTYENAIRDFYNQWAKGGGMWEGTWYSRTIINELLYPIIAFQGALGEGFYNQIINENPWLEDRIYFEIYSKYPWKGEWTSPWNIQRMPFKWLTGHDFTNPPGGLVNSASFRDLTAMWELAYLASSPAKEHAYWYLSRLPSITDYNGWTSYVLEFLIYDPNVIPQAPNSLSPFYYSSGMGYVFTMSDWSEDATWLAFSAGTALRYYGSGAELGRFDLHKYAYLTGDYFHFNPGLNWLHRIPIFNNCMLIGDINYGAYPVNEIWRHPEAYGGQIGWWFKGKGLSESGHGHFKGLENTNDYTYMASDLSGAYMPNLIDKFDREIIFIRPDYVFVFDRVQTDQPSTKKRFAAQFRNEPAISGNTVVATNRIYVDGNPKSDQAKLFVKTLLPDGYIITNVGPGWDGHGGPDKMQENQPGNSWRIEVSSQTGQQNKDGLFLHVLYPALATTQTMPETKRIDASTNNMTGAQMEDPAKGEGATNIVMFSKSYNTQLEENITYDVTGSGSSKHLIVDLKPNTQFTITNRTIDTDTVVDTKTQASSTQGTLYFETILGSNHRISITPGGQVIRGDVNRDGLVNVVDVQLTVNQFLGVLPQTQEADLNNDGVVNVIDVQLVVNIILGG